VAVLAVQLADTVAADYILAAAAEWCRELGMHGPWPLSSAAE